MSIVIPPRDFWPPDQTITITLNGVTGANAPLSISSSIMSIANASTIQSGIINLLAQGFAGLKNFQNGLQIAAGTSISEISVDSTFAIATDAQLSTKKAIKDYIATLSTGLVTSVTYPLYMTLHNLSMYEASALESGFISTGPQTITGVKSFLRQGHFMEGTMSSSSITGSLWVSGGLGVSGNAYVRDSICFDKAVGPTPVWVCSTIPGQYVQMFVRNGGYDYAETSLVQVQNVSTGGHLDLKSAVSGRINLTTGAAGTPTMIIAPTTITNYLPTTIESGGTQLTLTNVGNTSFQVSNTGDLTVNASGNDINFHSSDTVHILNNTASTSKVTGALQIDGGLGVVGDIWCDQLRTMSIDGSQLRVSYNAGTYAEFTVNNAGVLTLASTGQYFDTASPIMHRILNDQDASSYTTGSIHTEGGLSTSKTIYAGTGVRAGGAVECTTLTGRNTVNSAELSISDNPVTGFASMSIVTGGGTTFNTSGPLNITGGTVTDITISANQQVRLLNPNDATTNLNGSIHTAGGMSAAKTIRSGVNIIAAQTVQGLQLSGVNLINVPELLITDSLAVGQATASIITGGHTSLLTSGSLYINNVLYTPFIPYPTDTVVHNLGNAALGSTCSVDYTRIGTIINAKFAALAINAVANSSIVSTNAMLATFRPASIMHCSMIVINNSAYINARCEIDTAGLLKIFSDVGTGLFTNGTPIGWPQQVLTWSI